VIGVAHGRAGLGELRHLVADQRDHQPGEDAESRKGRDVGDHRQQHDEQHSDGQSLPVQAVQVAQPETDVREQIEGDVANESLSSWWLVSAT